MVPVLPIIGAGLFGFYSLVANYPKLKSYFRPPREGIHSPVVGVLFNYTNPICYAALLGPNLALVAHSCSKYIANLYISIQKGHIPINTTNYKYKVTEAVGHPKFVSSQPEYYNIAILVFRGPSKYPLGTEFFTIDLKKSNRPTYRLGLSIKKPSYSLSNKLSCFNKDDNNSRSCIDYISNKAYLEYPLGYLDVHKQSNLVLDALSVPQNGPSSLHVPIYSYKKWIVLITNAYYKHNKIY